MDIALEELEQSRTAGFPTLWTVYGDYEISGGVLRRARDDVVGMYAPLVRREIPGELAKLTRGDEAAVVRFAQRYGQLGHDQLVAPEEARGGDPVEWIWTHAETIKICLELTRLLKEDMREKVMPYLCSLPSWPVMMFCAKGHESSLTIAYEEKNAVSLARMVCRGLINPNIAGIYPELRQERAEDRIYFHFHAPIEAAYWRLAIAINGGNVKLCKECGSAFIQSDGRQQYCPPRFRQRESACAIRARVARLRKKA